MRIDLLAGAAVVVAAALAVGVAALFVSGVRRRKAAEEGGGAGGAGRLAPVGVAGARGGLCGDDAVARLHFEQCVVRGAGAAARGARAGGRRAGPAAARMVGAYAMRGNLADVWLMLGFGALGYGMQRGGYPVAPLILALILGPMAEEVRF